MQVYKFGKLTVLQKILAGDLKWKGPRLGFVFILFLMNCAYLTLFLVTKKTNTHVCQ